MTILKPGLIVFVILVFAACASNMSSTPPAVPSHYGNTRHAMSSTATPPPGLGVCNNPPGSGSWACWNPGGGTAGLPQTCAAEPITICMSVSAGITFVDPQTGGTDYLNPNIPASGPGRPSATYRGYVNCVKQRVITDLQGDIGYNIIPGSALASINNVAINTSVPDAANDDMADGFGELVGANKPYLAVYLLQDYGAGSFSAATQQAEGDLLGPAIDYEDHYCGTIW